MNLVTEPSLKQMMQDTETVRKHFNAIVHKYNNLRSGFAKLEKNSTNNGIDILTINEDFPDIAARLNSVATELRTVKRKLVPKLEQLAYLENRSEENITKLQSNHFSMITKLQNCLNNLTKKLDSLEDDLDTDEEIFENILHTRKLQFLTYHEQYYHPQQLGKMPKKENSCPAEDLLRRVLMDAIIQM